MVSPLAQPVGGVRGQGGLPALPTQLCSFTLLSHKLGEEVMGLLQNLPSPAFPSQTLTLFSTTSPSILTPELESRGVWFKARSMGIFFSPMTVVAPRSNPQVHWERR